MKGYDYIGKKCPAPELPDTQNDWYNKTKGDVPMPKRYETEFKKEIVSQYVDGGRSAKSLANELGLHENTIYKWAEQYRQDPENAFPGSGHMKPEQDELRRAQRRIRELETEVEILKKATAYFAKHNL